MPATKDLKKLLKAKRLDRKYGQLSESERKTLEKLYTQGPATYGSVENLKNASKLPKRQWKHFWLKQTLIQNIALPEKKFHD